MATFSLRIECDNSAFFPTASDRNAELARILRDLANRLENDSAMSRAPDVSEYILRDLNGNRVGKAAIGEG